MSETIVRGWQGRLYPNAANATRLNQWSGSLRFLWNRLLEKEKAEYAACGKFIWRKELQALTLAMKRVEETEWLADLPAHAVLDTVARLDGALRRMVKLRKQGKDCGFPCPKKKFVNEAGIYCVGQASEIGSREAALPKLGRVKLRGGDVPKGRLLASRVWRDGARWMLSAQFECARPEPLPPTGVTVGIDLGVATLVTAYDGVAFQEWKASRHLRKAHKRLRRAQRALSRRKKGSARRRSQARKVGVIHRKVRDRRKDLLHQVSHSLTAKADVLKVETLNVRDMAKNHHIALSVADAGMSRLVTFFAYKADWRGRSVVKIDRWFPGSQTCCKCGERHREMKNLSRDTMRCACGNVMGRDRNAAVNHHDYVPGGTGERLDADRATRVEIGDQGQRLAPPPVPVNETRMLADVA